MPVFPGFLEIIRVVNGKIKMTFNNFIMSVESHFVF